MAMSEFQRRLTDEYVLADISVRLDLKFPYRINDRIKAVKQIVNRPEYEAYRDDFHRVCDNLLRYDDLRNFMAHGMMHLETSPDRSHRFILRRYERLARGKFRHRMLEFSVEDLQEQANELLTYLSSAYAVFQKFYKEQAVETFVHPNT
jgi:hypothetical protein